MVGPIEQKAVEEFAAQSVPEIANLFQPLIDAVKPVMGFISAVVGGLFGLYLIFIIVRLYYEKRKLRLLKNINYDLDYLNQHFNLPYSREKETPGKVMPLSNLKEIMKEKERKAKEKLEEEERGEKKKEKAQKKKGASFRFPISIRLKEKQEKE